jgi:hypothetical protein
VGLRSQKRIVRDGLLRPCYGFDPDHLDHRLALLYRLGHCPDLVYRLEYDPGKDRAPQLSHHQQVYHPYLDESGHYGHQPSSKHRANPNKTLKFALDQAGNLLQPHLHDDRDHVSQDLDDPYLEPEALLSLQIS